MMALRRAAGIADSEEFSDDRRHQRDLSLLVERVLNHMAQRSAASVDAPPQDPARWLLKLLADAPGPEIKRLAFSSSCAVPASLAEFEATTPRLQERMNRIRVVGPMYHKNYYFRHSNPNRPIEYLRHNR
jgi:hypothetical protein